MVPLLGFWLVAKWAGLAKTPLFLRYLPGTMGIFMGELLASGTVSYLFIPDINPKQPGSLGCTSKAQVTCGHQTLSIDDRRIRFLLQENLQRWESLGGLPSNLHWKPWKTMEKSWNYERLAMVIYLVVSTHLKNMLIKMGIFPQVSGWKYKVFETASQ